MRITLVTAACIASALVLVAGCSANGPSGLSAVSSTTGQAKAIHLLRGRSTSVLPVRFQSYLARPHSIQTSQPYDVCQGSFIYWLSDVVNGVVDIFDPTGRCGQLTGFFEPQGLAVHRNVLYVADTLNRSIKVFPFGATSPSKTLVDPHGQLPVDVALAPDGTIIASNITDIHGGNGSLSTWTHDGTFVGHYAVSNLAAAYFLVAFHNGDIYLDGYDDDGAAAIWVLQCPAGVCNEGTELGTPLLFPGGLTESKSGDLIAIDQQGNTANTFEPPSMTPVSFSLNGDDNVSVITIPEGAFRQYIMDTTDATIGAVACYNYRQSGRSSFYCGTLFPSDPGGSYVGIAVLTFP